MLTLDGKATAIEGLEGPYVQVQRGQHGAHRLVRTVSAMLTSCRARPCLDAVPISAYTNEMGHYPEVLKALHDAYGSLDLFRLVTYDAGACAKVNARFTREHDLHYMFRIKDSQPKLLAEAERRLGGCRPDLVEDENVNGKLVRRELFLASEVTVWPRWTEARTLVRVRRTVIAPDGTTAIGERYWVASLSSDALTREQWLTVARRHWGVENNGHNIWDTVFCEDDRPWIKCYRSR